MQDHIDDGRDEDQRDDWQAYGKMLDDRPAIITLDLGLAEIAPEPSLPVLLIGRMPLKSPTEDGLASEAEAEAALESIDEAIAALMESGVYNAAMAARVTTGGVVDYYFYIGPDGGALTAAASANGSANAPKTLAEALSAIVAGFPGYQIAWTQTPDSAWDVYADKLFPNPWEQQQMGSMQMLMMMQDDGDDTSKPRELDHLIIAPDQTSQKAIAKRAEEMGFDVEAPEGDADEGYFLVLTADGVPDDIDEIIWPLFNLCEEFGAEYDGWEADPAD